MKLQFARTVAITALHGAVALPGASGQATELDQFLVAKMRAAQVPGLAACVVDREGIVWSGAYGLADVEAGAPATDDTLFALASISKTVVGTALMQLEEQDRIRLDDDVAPWLDFRPRNPAHPQAPVTARQLLAHTSGVKDNWAVLEGLYTRGDSPVPLARFVRAYLEPGGPFFDAQKNFAKKPPGKGFVYSNEGFALLGAVVEGVAGEPFEEYCRREIFEPLGMHDTAWRLSELDVSQVARPHAWNGAKQTFEPYELYGYPDYPSGLLRTSAPQLAGFLLAHIGDGAWRGRRILEAATVAEMQTVQYPNLDATQGLAFYYWNHPSGVRLGHAGGDYGVTTEMWMRPADHTGVVLLANGEAQFGPWLEILDRLFEEAERR